MNKAEFAEIKKKFEAEEKRWKSVKVGDIVYDQVARGGWDMEYFEVKVTEVNVDKRYVRGKDKSQKNKAVELTYFLTEKEFKEVR